MTGKQKIQNIPYNKRYNPDGTHTSAFAVIMKKVYMNSRTIIFKNTDLTVNCNRDEYLDPETYHNMYDCLDDHKEYLDRCSIFIIEEQMSFGKKHNTMALKLGQHCYSYMCFKYGRFKQILYFPSYHKTQIFGAKKERGKPTKRGLIRYKAMGDKARKKWAEDKAIEILTQRDDMENLTNLQSQRKNTKRGTKKGFDDLSDTILMVNAFCYLAFVDKTI